MERELHPPSTAIFTKVLVQLNYRRRFPLERLSLHAIEGKIERKQKKGNLWRNVKASDRATFATVVNSLECFAELLWLAEPKRKRATGVTLEQY